MNKIKLLNYIFIMWFSSNLFAQSNAQKGIIQDNFNEFQDSLFLYSTFLDSLKNIGYTSCLEVSLNVGSYSFFVKNSDSTLTYFIDENNDSVHFFIEGFNDVLESYILFVTENYEQLIYDKRRPSYKYSEKKSSKSYIMISIIRLNYWGNKEVKTFYIRKKYPFYKKMSKSIYWQWRESLRMKQLARDIRLIKKKNTPTNNKKN